MTEFRDLTRLPRNEDYWAGLEERIMAELGPRMRGEPASTLAWWEPLANRAWSLGMVATAAAVAAVLILPERAPERDTNLAGLLRVPENEQEFLAVLNAPSPPRLATLVVAMPEIER